MKLTYEIELADIVALQIYLSNHSKVVKSRLRNEIIIVMVILIALSASRIFDEDYQGLAISIGFIILWFFLYPYWQRRRTKKFFYKYAAENFGESFVDSDTLELLDDGIHSVSFTGISTYKYSAIGRIVETDEYTYIFIGKTQALILPHDRIPKDQIDAIVVEIRKRMELAGSQIDTE